PVGSRRAGRPRRHHARLVPTDRLVPADRLEARRRPVTSVSPSLRAGVGLGGAVAARQRPGQEATMTDDRYPYITSGPQLLNDGLRMLAGAEEVLKRPNPGLDELAAGQLRATIAKARIQAADALGWGTLVAAESEEWGESWRDA